MNYFDSSLPLLFHHHHSSKGKCHPLGRNNNYNTSIIIPPDHMNPAFFDNRLYLLPQIGELIDLPDAINLCVLFHLAPLAREIQERPDLFMSFRFDGVSGISEWTSRRVFGVSEKDTIRARRLQAIALVHDLKYAFGRHGDKKARREADACFRESLEVCVVPPCENFRAWLGWSAVRAFGGERYLFRTGYCWGFARIRNA